MRKGRFPLWPNRDQPGGPIFVPTAKSSVVPETVPRQLVRRLSSRLVSEVRRRRLVLEMPADRPRVLAAMQATHEPQRHVDPGGNALAGDEAAVDDIACIANYGDVTAALQGVLEGVVRGDPATTDGLRNPRQP